jgi:hypothetical protein
MENDSARDPVPKTLLPGYYRQRHDTTARCHASQRGEFYEQPMAEIVNLNRFRKAQKRQEETRQAEANRAKFGRTKTEKENDRRAEERRRQEIDDKKLDD